MENHRLLRLLRAHSDVNFNRVALSSQTLFPKQGIIAEFQMSLLENLRILWNSSIKTAWLWHWWFTIKLYYSFPARLTKPLRWKTIFAIHRLDSSAFANLDCSYFNHVMTTCHSTWNNPTKNGHILIQFNRLLEVRDGTPICTSKTNAIKYGVHTQLHQFISVKTQRIWLSEIYPQKCW